MGFTMRVITGTARGLNLTTLEGTDVRPTASRVKEALFSVIQFELEGRTVLDLFAGSGQLGIEALSRGAARCVFIDQNADAVQVIRDNLSRAKLDRNATVISADYASYLKRCPAVFDVALMDPPYGKGLVEAALPLTAPLMSQNGVIVCEAAKKDVLPPSAGEFVLQRIYSYGITSFGVYRHGEPS